jgi:hypothetical protein
MSFEFDPLKTSKTAPRTNGVQSPEPNGCATVSVDGKETSTTWNDLGIVGALILFLFSILKMIGVFEVVPAWVETGHKWIVIGLLSVAGLGLAKRLKIDGYLAFAFIAIVLVDFWYHLTPNRLTDIQVPTATASGFFISAAILSGFFAARSATTFSKRVSRFGNVFAMITVAASIIILCLQPLFRSPTQYVQTTGAATDSNCVVADKAQVCPEKQR